MLPSFSLPYLLFIYIYPFLDMDRNINVRIVENWQRA